VAGLKIGENSYVNHTTLVIEDPRTPQYQLIIGDNVSIGHFCYFSTKMKDLKDPSSRGNRITGSIIIDNNVWIGNGVIVYPGVTIGHDSIIGGNTVITKSVPPNTLVRNTQSQEKIRREDTTTLRSG
jgi:acetyltransferase-like isoleucine patch superfamily enzyme